MIGAKPVACMGDAHICPMDSRTSRRQRKHLKKAWRATPKCRLQDSRGGRPEPAVAPANSSADVESPRAKCRALATAGFPRWKPVFAGREMTWRPWR